MKKVFYILAASILLVSLFGCEPSDSAKTFEKKTGESNEYTTFNPPADGKITIDQKDRYIGVAKDLTAAVEKQRDIIQEFNKKYNITDETQLGDLEKKDKKAFEEWQKIGYEWTAKEMEIYRKNNLSQAEFEWVASALTDSINTTIQQEVEKALTSAE